MKAAEVLAEYEWLVEGGWSPLMACRILGRRADSMARLAYRQGRVDIARKLDRKEWRNDESA
jgi:hypothetical protein